jgi:hypothetical protein
MKGSIVNCIEELVTAKFGRPKFDEILAMAGLPRDSIFLPIEDVPDAKVLEIIGATAKALGITNEQAADAFGEYWMCVYALKVYKPYYAGVKTAKEFILKIDSMHKRMTKNIMNAHPPEFDYRWTDPQTLVMTYKSRRGLVDLAVSMAKAVGTYFKDDLKVKRIGPSEIQIRFP